MNGIYLIIGGNEGDRYSHIKSCKNMISQYIGKILDISPIYETAPWGNTLQAHFLNCVLKIETTLSPLHLLNQCLFIEKKMGRIRGEKWASRIMDIDILFYHNLILKTTMLSIPHPQLYHRRFVLEPLHYIAPQEIDPASQQSIHSLLLACNDTLWVKIWKPS
jgi:2-amino-4-hydroxy-6-hydroxymethyldihydropteridine diphosphokinase